MSQVFIQHLDPSAGRLPVSAHLLSNGEVILKQPATSGTHDTDIVVLSETEARRLMTALDLHFSALDGEKDE